VVLRSVDRVKVGKAQPSPDEQVLSLIQRIKPDLLAIDGPLSLPPCVECLIPQCPTVAKCEVPAVQWMREEANRLHWKRPPSPYSLRPVDLLLRGQWAKDMVHEVPVEESFGSARAPLAARILYLRRHWGTDFVAREVNPRLALTLFAPWYGIETRDVRRCRLVEEGASHRMRILSRLSEETKDPQWPRPFLYEADQDELAQDISSFDAFLSGWMGVLWHLGLAVEPDWSESWGWVDRPRSSHSGGEASP
jgi:hypothetical protein